MKRLILSLLLACASVSYGAWNSPKSEDIRVTTNNYDNLSGSTLQAVLDYIDDNVAFTADGYVTTTYLDSLNLAGTTNNNSYSATNTYTSQMIVTNVLVRGAVSNASGIAFNKFNGFKMNILPGNTLTGSSSFVTINRLTNEVYDTDSWVSSGLIYPTVAGYYEVHASGKSEGVETLVRVGISSNSYETLGTLLTNQMVSGGSALIYLSTTTNYLTFDICTLTGASTITNLTVWGKYIGE